MPFTGKATYTAGATLPEIAEDVSDLIGLNSPFETPLLDALGDPAYAAHSTIHEWLEDDLVSTTDRIESVTNATHIVVFNSARFRPGDQLRVEGGAEIVLVTAVDGFPAGTTLSEEQLNTALRVIWENSSGSIDLLVMGGGPKRALNSFIGSNRRFTADSEVFKNLVSAYESDYGVCRVAVSRFVP